MTECGGLVHPNTITFKSQKISYATGAAMLLSSFTIAGTTDIHILSCLAAFFHQAMALLWSLRMFLVITPFFVTILVVMVGPCTSAS